MKVFVFVNILVCVCRAADSNKGPKQQLCAWKDQSDVDLFSVSVLSDNADDNDTFDDDFIVETHQSRGLEEDCEKGCKKTLEKCKAKCKMGKARKDCLAACKIDSTKCGKSDITRYCVTIVDASDSSFLQSSGSVSERSVPSSVPYG